VQLYVKDVKSSVRRPEKELKGFERSSLIREKKRRLHLLWTKGLLHITILRLRTGMLKAESF